MTGNSESKPPGLKAAFVVSLLNLGVEVANAMPSDETLLTPAKLPSEPDLLPPTTPACSPEGSPPTEPAEESSAKSACVTVASTMPNRSRSLEG